MHIFIKKNKLSLKWNLDINFVRALKAQLDSIEHMYSVYSQQVDSIDKVVRLLDVEEEEGNTSHYTFANLHEQPCDLEDLEIEEVKYSYV